MGNKIYLVKHLYDVDGGFGDAVENEEVIAIYSNKFVAKRFVKKWNNPHVYDEPYESLWCNSLKIEEMEIDNVSIENDPFKNSRRW